MTLSVGKEETTMDRTNRQIEEYKRTHNPQWFFNIMPKYFFFYVGKTLGRWVFQVNIYIIGFGYAW